MRKTLLFILATLFSMPGRSSEYDLGLEDPYYCWAYSWRSRYEQGEGKLIGGGFEIYYYLFKDESYEYSGKVYHLVRGMGDTLEPCNVEVPYPLMDKFKENWPYCLHRLIGVRFEDGYIYVNREEYLSIMEKDSPWSIFADKDYIPYRQTDDGELILYDFNMKEGDKFMSVVGYQDISVVSVEKVKTSDGVARRLLTLSNGYKLLEGIGCLNSAGMFFFYLNPSSYMKFNCGSTILWEQCCYDSYEDNGTVIYDTNGIFEMGISTQRVEQTTPLYDLQGRHIDGQTKPGVYIRDGRKVVVK